MFTQNSVYIYFKAQPADPSMMHIKTQIHEQDLVVYLYNVLSLPKSKQVVSNLSWPGSEKGLSILFSATVVSVVVCGINFMLLFCFICLSSLVWWRLFHDFVAYGFGASHLCFCTVYFFMSITFIFRSFHLYFLQNWKEIFELFRYLLKPKILVYLNTKF